MNKKEINYLETFFFNDIPYQPIPVYAISESNRIFNIKTILYPNSRSSKKYTRRKQLVKRSLQAKMMDMLLNIGYFDPLIVYREYPIIIQNSGRLNNQTGSFYLLDYFFANLKWSGGIGVALELDSDYHSSQYDSIRDKYNESLGIFTYRISNLEKPDIQKGKFRDFTKFLRTLEPIQNPVIFDFQKDIRNRINDSNNVNLFWQEK